MAEEKKPVPEEETPPEVTVRDRRRVTPEGEIRDSEPQAEAGPADEGRSPEPPPEAAKTEAHVPTLSDFLRIMLLELRAQAWPLLARSAESGTLSPEDQAQARFGKELYGFLLERLQAAPDLSAEEKEELQRWQAAEGGNFYGVARLMLMELHSRAWQSLGLIPNPQTHLITTDLSQARQAIDTYSEILNRLEASRALSDAEFREFRRLKNDLQMNYVQRVGLR
jgi:hypothetical protein